MDDPALPADEHARALRALVLLNRVCRVPASIVPAAMKRAVSRGCPGGAPGGKRHGDQIRMLDVACGAGDVPVAVARRLAAAGLGVEATLLDISGTAIDTARRRVAACGVPGATRFRYLQGDVVRDGLVNHAGARYDLVTSSLFLHHLREADIVRVLGAMAEALGPGGVLIVSDLVRSRVHRALAWIVPRLITRSRVVHVDAARSVEGALTRAELLELAAAAGLGGASVRPAWPFRMVLRWDKPAEQSAETMPHASRGAHAA